ncbi:hypothetical protein FHR34_007215 [Kitasatospora kifunensis]|uniref:Uncharacterized protein n=1 Tax=Kitasatospora kifunensis TaxID=58351 RepID=A0A7W7R9V9_KITKI|nr:hypothetical protein [Kitasatospora kifunensis]
MKVSAISWRVAAGVAVAFAVAAVCLVIAGVVDLSSGIETGGGFLITVAMGATSLAIVFQWNATQRRKLTDLPAARPGWTLHVGPNYIMTTGPTGRREFTWDGIKKVTIRNLQSMGPHQFTALVLGRVS